MAQDQSRNAQNASIPVSWPFIVQHWLVSGLIRAPRRFHVSQDRHEIWLIFAEYDEEYIKYIQDGSYNPDSPLSFLKMHEFGPFDTLKRDDMAELGPILLALTLRADQDRREEEGKL